MIAPLYTVRIMPDGQVSIRRAVISNVRVTPASQMMLQPPIHGSETRVGRGFDGAWSGGPTDVSGTASPFNPTQLQL
jgi:hypothetical protein